MFIQLSCALLLCVHVRWVSCRCCSVEFQQILAFTGGIWDLARPLRHSVAGRRPLRTLAENDSLQNVAKSSKFGGFQIFESAWLKLKLTCGSEVYLAVKTNIYNHQNSAAIWLHLAQLQRMCVANVGILETRELQCLGRSGFTDLWVGCGRSKSLIAKMEDWKG